MKILAQTFKADLPDVPTRMIISRAVPFKADETGFLAGDFPVIVCAIEDANLSVPEINNIPATTAADVPIKYHVTVEQQDIESGVWAAVGFYLSNDYEYEEEGESFTLNDNPSGETTWNEIRQLKQAQDSSHRIFQYDAFNTRQSDARYLQQSQFDGYLAQISDLINGLPVDGGIFGISYDQPLIDGGQL